MKRFRIVPVLACLLLLAGCGLFLTHKEKAMRNDPNYQAGYSDGCASANAQNTRYRGDTRRDDALFNASEPYRNGWHSGFSACRSSYAPAPGMQRGPIPDPGPLH